MSWYECLPLLSRHDRETAFVFTAKETIPPQQVQGSKLISCSGQPSPSTAGNVTPASPVERAKWVTDRGWR